MFEVKIGKEFPVNHVEEEKRRFLKELTRSTIAIAVVVAAMLALLGAVAICAYQGDFSALVAVWAVIGPMLGWIIGHYFRGAGDGNEDHTSTA